MKKHIDNFKNKFPDELTKAVATSFANMITGFFIVSLIGILTFILGGNDLIRSYTKSQMDLLNTVADHLKTHEHNDSLNNAKQNNNQLKSSTHDKIEK